MITIINKLKVHNIVLNIVNIIETILKLHQLIMTSIMMQKLIWNVSLGK